MFAHNLKEKKRTEDVQIIDDVEFPSLLLPEFILRGLLACGFKKPSPIQLSSIPLARCGLDLIVQAKSGTGKTLVFAITALEAVQVKIKRLQVVILAPTREIALQNADVIKTVGQCLKGIRISTFIGGISIDTDKHSLLGCQIAVGAPGRVRHLIQQGFMDCSSVRLLVLDEADKLMEEAFLSDVNYIFNKCCSSKQTMACSATYTPELLEFVSHYMRSGRHVVPEGSTVPVLLGLRQFVYILPDHANSFARLKLKQDTLFHLISTVRFDQALIFTNYITRAESLSTILSAQGWSAAFLTAKQDQQHRINTLEKLKSHKTRIVVATDLASRGLDASSINLVINIDVPPSGATYLHRMGRAGRFGSQGICINIVNEGVELRKFTNILGDIGGTSMNVNIIPKDKTFDLWSVETDKLKKLSGTSMETDNQSSTEIKNYSLLTESNSSADNHSPSASADSEDDSVCDTTGDKEAIPNKKITKLGNRERKFSTSLKEQVEGSDSSDCEQFRNNNKIENIVESPMPKPTINLTLKVDSSSQIYSKSSETDELDSSSSSNTSSNNVDTTSDGFSHLPDVIENVIPIDDSPTNKQYISTNNNNYQLINYPQMPQDDWCARIEMQIQNFVHYTHYFHPYNFHQYYSLNS